MKCVRFSSKIFPFFLLLLTLQACAANKKMTVGATALLLEEVARSSYRQSDLRMIREGTPAYLMLMEGMVAAWPDNAELLLAAGQGHASYASTFAEDPDHARMLYQKAKTYALKALEKRGVPNPDRGAFEGFEKALNKLEKADVPYLFWSASCWGNWIGLNLDSMEAMAALPRVELMMRRVLELDEGYYYGGPHLFLGIWYAMRPKMAGGDLSKSQNHFQKALELGQGKFLMADVHYAQYYARKAFDRELFESTLKKVLAVPADIFPDLTLLNTVAHQKAREMLKRADEYF
jgi:hypothetical protein